MMLQAPAEAVMMLQYVGVDTARRIYRFQMARVEQAFSIKQSKLDYVFFPRVQTQWAFFYKTH